VPVKRALFLLIAFFAGSIADGVIGIFIGIKFLRSHFGSEVESDFNRNWYQVSFLGVKLAAV